VPAMVSAVEGSTRIKPIAISLVMVPQGILRTSARALHIQLPFGSFFFSTEQQLRTGPIALPESAGRRRTILGMFAARASLYGILPIVASSPKSSTLWSEFLDREHLTMFSSSTVSYIEIEQGVDAEPREIACSELVSKVNLGLTKGVVFGILYILHLGLYRVLSR
jgi:hypothetical protein